MRIFLFRYFGGGNLFDKMNTLLSIVLVLVYNIYEMKDFRKGLGTAIIVILVIIFGLAYMYYFLECSNTTVSEMQGYCIYLLSNK